MEDPSYFSGFSMEELLDLNDRSILEFILRDTYHLTSRSYDIEYQLRRKVGLLQRQVNDLKRQHTREPVYKFPSFSKLPAEIRCFIWDYAIPRRFVMKSDNGNILQRPPDVAHVCREARSVATRHGRMWKTLYLGTPRWTWFQADRDVVIWASRGDLGNLPSVVETIVLPGSKFEKNAVDNFLSLIRNDGFYHLKTIYVEMCNKFTIVGKKGWSPQVSMELFGFNKIILPNMESSSTCEAKIFKVLEREKTSSNIPQGIFEYWCGNVLTTNPSSPKARLEVDDWLQTKKTFSHSWPLAMAAVTPGIGLLPDKKSDLSLDIDASMPFSGRTWMQHFVESKPNIIPTCIFALVDDRLDEHNASNSTYT